MVKRGNFLAEHVKQVEMWMNNHKSEGSGSFHYTVPFRTDWPEDILDCAKNLIYDYLSSKRLSHSEFIFVTPLHGNLELFEIFISWSWDDTKKAVEAGYNIKTGFFN